MEVKELQEKIVEFTRKWDQKYKKDPNDKTTFIHLTEEIGELAREYVNRELGRAKYNKENVENAIADIILQIVKLADINGLDVEKIVLDVMEEDEKRLLEQS